MRLRTLLPAGVKACIKRSILSFQLRGDTFECPLCGGCFSAMLAGGLDLPVVRERQIVGAGRRENAICPRCESSDRERLVYLYLLRRTDVFKRSIRLLHIAPERGLQTKMKSCRTIDYLSGDLESPLAKVEMDITNIPWPNASFDAVICNHVLEHVPDDRQAMQEIIRVLRPGGWAILQVPLSLTLHTTHEDPTVTDPQERERLFAQSDHVRLYAPDDYVNRLASCGFQVRIVDLAEDLSAEQVSRFSLDPRERIFIGVNPIAPEVDQGVNP